MKKLNKAEILRTLLPGYNDGRRKTFYYAAVNLLPLRDMENVMKQIAENTTRENLTTKEKAEIAVSFFQNFADGQGIMLRIRKNQIKK